MLYTCICGIKTTYGPLCVNCSTQIHTIGPQEEDEISLDELLEQEDSEDSED